MFTMQSDELRENDPRTQLINEILGAVKASTDADGHIVCFIDLPWFLMYRGVVADISEGEYLVEGGHVCLNGCVVRDSIVRMEHLYDVVLSIDDVLFIPYRHQEGADDAQVAAL